MPATTASAIKKVTCVSFMRQPPVVGDATDRGRTWHRQCRPRSGPPAPPQASDFSLDTRSDRDMSGTMGETMRGNVDNRALRCRSTDPESMSESNENSPSPAPEAEAAVTPPTMPEAPREPAPEANPKAAPEAAPEAAAPATPEQTAVPAAEQAQGQAPAAETEAAEAAESAPAPAPAPAAAPIPDLSPAAVATALAERFPALFGAGRALPIKLRIQADIQARAPGLFNKKSLSMFLHRHTTTTAYLKALASTPTRHDLDGAPAGDVAAEHRDAAGVEVERRRAIVDARRQAERAAQRRPARGPAAAGAHPASPAVPPAGSYVEAPEAGRASAQASGADQTPLTARTPRTDHPPRRAPQITQTPQTAQTPQQPRQPRPPRPDRPGRPDHPTRPPRREGERPPQQARPPRPDFPDRPDRFDRPPHPPVDDRPQRPARPEPPPAEPQGDPAEMAARRDRAALLRAYEGSTLTRANFCVLKRITEVDLEAQLVLARQERGPRRDEAPGFVRPRR